MATESPVPESSTPQPDLRSLDCLAGTWRLGGDTSGTIRYEWMPGGHFLLQQVDMMQDGHHVQGLEVIGHLRPLGEGPGPDIVSRFYGSEGETIDYVYEVEGRSLTIWGGVKGSPAYFRGEFSADGRSNSGAWVYPGGGYTSTMTRED